MWSGTDPHLLVAAVQLVLELRDLALLVAALLLQLGDQPRQLGNLAPRLAGRRARTVGRRQQLELVLC